MEEKVVEQKTAVAELRHARISARKVKIVIDLIRGKSAKEAIANAVNNHHMDETKLVISEIYANQGPTMKRILPRAKGSADRIRKRTSHIKVVLTEA